MTVIVGIDDTDRRDTPGTGHLTEAVRAHIETEGVTRGVSVVEGITRHQLYVHPDIPYTSHNSAMAFVVLGTSIDVAWLTARVTEIVYGGAVDGSDPGVAVYADPGVGEGAALPEDGAAPVDALVAFGRAAKVRRLTQTEAYRAAAAAGVGLHGLGGTRDGIIGALAAVGLRLSGSDGRFRGGVALAPGAYPVEYLIEASGAQRVEPAPPEGATVRVSDSKVKTIFRDGVPVLPLTADHATGTWRALTRDEIKAREDA